jgi:hypothetical protein
MIKNSKEVQAHFNTHAKVNEFHFTSDGQPFTNHNYASAHAANLFRDKKGNHSVITVTREEAFAEGAPVDTIAPLQDAVNKAQVVYDEAVKARAALDAAGTGGEKTKATNAVKAAEKALNAAKEALGA